MRSRTFVLLTGAFFLVSGLVYFDVTAPLDSGVVLFASEHVGNSEVDLFMQIITESGDTFYMLGFGILMLIIKKTRRIGITLMILIVISTLVLDM